MKNSFDLKKEEKDVLKRKIQTFFLEERDQELGELAAGMVLDFFLEELGPHIYNMGLTDAKKWFKDKLEGLEADFYTLEKRVDGWK